MAAVPRLALPHFFQTFAPTYVLGTTYTVSLAFFEGMVFPEMPRTHLRRCLLLCDRIGFQRALVESTALRGVGREYMAVCAPTPHSFHPKVWLMIGEDEAALLVGSGNLTQSGLMTNLELFDAVRLGKGGAHRALLEDILRFLDGLRGLWSGSGRDDLLVLETLGETREALARLGDGMSSEGSDGVRFLTNFGGPLLEQFREFFEGANLYAAAPYFGGSASALRSLRERLSLRKLKVFPGLHGGTLDVPLRDVTAIPGTSAHRLALSNSGAFAHLKMYGGDGPRGRWFFTTSANCTEAALGGLNVEAGLMRPVSRAVLQTYFAEESGEALPEKQRPASLSESTRWLTFTATNTGSAIEMVLSDVVESWLPLGDVRLTLQWGGEVFDRPVAELFAHRLAERVPWNWFFGGRDPTGGSPLLRVEARGADGRPVEGAAFIDQPLLLTSDPIHRSAWRATLAILDREGLPEASDLACVFHLVQELFEPSAAANEDVETKPERTSEKRPVEPVDKAPIWPPVSDGFVPRHLHCGGNQTVQWFQKILSELLGRTRAATSSLSSTSSLGDREEGEDSEIPEPSQPLLRAARSVWGPAAKSYERLIERLESMQVTAPSAGKIWPVSVAILLVTLATRRQIARSVPDADVPAVAELVGRFLRALFADRSQGWRHGLDDGGTLGPTVPSVASLLHEVCSVRPTEDIAGVLRLLFAFQHASSSRSGRAAFLEGWLLFRELCPEALTGGPPLAEYETFYRRYLDAEGEGLDWPQVSASWESLYGLGWPDHPGFQELSALVRQAAAKGAGPPQLPARLRDLWPQTERRIRGGKQWRCTVSRLKRYCTADGCPRGYLIEPTNRELAELRPTICRGCGLVLVPDRLASAFGEAT